MSEVVISQRSESYACWEAMLMLILLYILNTAFFIVTLKCGWIDVMGKLPIKLTTNFSSFH